MLDLQTRGEVDIFLDAWLAALRSGEYRQGTGYLRADDRYCCVGVACEVLGLPRTDYILTIVGGHQEKSTYVVPRDMIPDGDPYDQRSETEFPELVNRLIAQQYPGLISGAHWLSDGYSDLDMPPPLHPDESLYSLNDEVGLNFMQIADVIEGRREWIRSQ